MRDTDVLSHEELDEEVTSELYFCFGSEKMREILGCSHIRLMLCLLVEKRPQLHHACSRSSDVLIAPHAYFLVVVSD
jgi:hypothetical protein